ncbi:Na(+)/H(+) exchange regulatory cofactor NHE-RF3 [Synchiropus splendidus]|uniref:Na(+)/H(+) exchange regulatory cofactor NHE-RF3 n=1 Tax=Synchiropus splendidus TaxID=270530 RepID=UPI00237EA9F1|nr:Na(+)/H(+) exchange regulatory cofactor NHE-RF3 [Synchiropus splendidus]
MTWYKPKVISLTKRAGQTFGFYMRIENGEEGHLVRSLEMGGPAQLAGMKDGDRVIRVNGTFVDGMSHSEVVEMVRNSGPSVTFHTLDEASYRRAKAEGVSLLDPHQAPGGGSQQDPKLKLCYLVKAGSSFDFSVRSVKGVRGLFMTEVTPGGVASRAGVEVRDRLLELNGEDIKSFSHDQVVEKIKQGGSSLMFLLVDEQTEEYYQKKGIRMGHWLATTKHLPHKPRIINLFKGSDGYGFLLAERDTFEGHYIKDVDRGSPAEQAGLKEKDRLVAVDGKDVQGLNHQQVVDRIRESGNTCCLLVADRETDQMCKQGNFSPMIFWDETGRAAPPPSYTEAVHTQSFTRPEEPVPKLCRMEKTSSTFGFHLNGIQGVFGQYIKDVVKGGPADLAGLEDDDIVVEVNWRNVEQSTHEEVADLIRSSGNSLEMLVASREVYGQLKAKGVTITRLLITERLHEEVLSTQPLGQVVRARPDSPVETPRERSCSVSSTSSNDSIDVRL